jgi:hypothetical protein
MPQRRARSAARPAVIWPAHVWLVLYAVVTGHRWYDASRGTHENLTGLFMIAVIAIHAAVSLVGGGLLALFPKTRPAGFQMWLAYSILLGSLVAGSVLL